MGTTDVSILYPLPGAGEIATFVRPSEVGNHGALFAATDFVTVLSGHSGLERTSSSPASGYANLGLVGVRLDPCSARRGPGTCTSEVRLVLQALDTTMTGTTALDGGLHVVYDVPEAELVDMAQEILTLKKANGDLALQELAPHPILAAQGLGGAFATGLRSIVLFHLGSERVARATAFDHNMDPDSDGWTFASFERVGGALTPHMIPFQKSHQQTVAGSRATTENLVTESHATAFSNGGPDDVQAILSPGRTETGITPDMRASFTAALRVENPTVHNAETTTCGNCHLAEGATRIGKAFGLPEAGAFTSPRSLARVDERTSVTNLHAFGYLGRQVSIMQRTANESVQVADRIAALLAAR
ncbi:MAG: hypothetical protein HOO96_12940 [Polyangiaceae bacterium]|nr:hypothetical protein [Polyangiaceae bacterium]